MPHEKQAADGGFYLGFDSGGVKTYCILVDASGAHLTESILKKLKMENRPVPVAKAGGALGRSKFFDAAIDAGLERVAPRARVVSLQEKPREAAARLAIRLGRQKAHAG
jgi:hypothetical protein